MHSKKNIQILIIRYVIRRDLVYKRRLDSSWAKFASFTIVILISLCNKTNFILRCDGYYLLCANLIFFYFSFYSRSLFHFSNDVSTNRIIFFRKIGKFFTTINNKINNNELFFFQNLSVNTTAFRPIFISHPTTINSRYLFSRHFPTSKTSPSMSARCYRTRASISYASTNIPVSWTYSWRTRVSSIHLERGSSSSRFIPAWGIIPSTLSGRTSSTRRTW